MTEGNLAIRKPQGSEVLAKASQLLLDRCGFVRHGPEMRLRVARWDRMGHHGRVPTSMPPIPKPDEESKAAFRALVPDAPGVEVRPMFGNLAAFVNKNMFLALFGSDVAVRLPDADRDELLQQDGAAPFAPMPGRPMKEYVVLPAAWRGDRTRLDPWVERSLRYAAAMPPKPKKGK